MTQFNFSPVLWLRPAVSVSTETLAVVVILCTNTAIANLCFTFSSQFRFQFFTILHNYRFFLHAINGTKETVIHLYVCKQFKISFSDLDIWNFYYITVLPS